MDLSQLAIFIAQERNKFEREIRIKSRKLRAQDITKEIMKGINLNSSYFLQRDFKDGQSLRFNLCQNYYTASVYREELVLRCGDAEVAKFRGDKVTTFYNGLSKKILKAVEEEDVPF